MFDEAALGSSFDAALRSIPAPPVPLQAIIHRMHEARPVPVRGNAGFVRAAVAAAAILAILAGVYPAKTIAVMQSMEARYRAALQALGGTAPPPVPDALLAKLRVENATIAAAQKRVPFTIVPPAGLPADAVLQGVTTAPTTIYTKATHAWRKGNDDVAFSYKRSSGRQFILITDLYDPRNGPQPKYMFEAKDPGPDGRPVLVRHLHFAWRNGNQITIATAGPGINADEILKIERAMHGVPLPLRPLHAPNTAPQSKMYLHP